MTAIFNQYSFVWALLVLIVVAIGVMRVVGLKRRMIGLVIALLALIFGGAGLALRQTVSDVSSTEAAAALIGNGKPTFVEFFSQY